MIHDAVNEVTTITIQTGVFLICGCGVRDVVSRVRGIVYWVRGAVCRMRGIDCGVRVLTARCGVLTVG